VIKAKRDLAADKVSDLEFRIEEKREAGRPVGSLSVQLDAAQEKLAILEARLAAQRRLEAAVWRDLWRTPAAAQWERLGWTRDIALYVRLIVLAELGDMDAMGEARQWSDRLGLNPLAMLRLRWQIAVDEVEERRQQQPASRTRYADLRVMRQETASDAAAGS
jgi:hypothetical protein